jgi:hypothetical protein
MQIELCGEGIDISKLEPETIIEVQTKNSLYKIELTSNHFVFVEGGYFPERTKMIFTGSTWGGSMIKPKWIGKDMHLEFVFPNETGQPALPRFVTTTRIREATIHSSNYHYCMNWLNPDDEA